MEEDSQVSRREAETGVMCLQVKGRRGFQGTPELKRKARDRFSPGAFRGTGVTLSTPGFGTFGLQNKFFERINFLCSKPTQDTDRTPCMPPTHMSPGARSEATCTTSPIPLGCTWPHRLPGRPSPEELGPRPAPLPTTSPMQPALCTR